MNKYLYYRMGPFDLPEEEEDEEEEEGEETDGEGDEKR